MMFRRAGLALWADLRDRGIDLWAVLDGDESEVTPAEALAVADSLPDTSRTRAALVGASHLAGWGYDRQLLVHISNLALGLLQTVPQWKDGQAPRLEPITDPFIEHIVTAQREMVLAKKREKTKSNAGVLAMLGGIRR